MDQAELRQWEARCIQEEPPRCTAACPLHVDARAVCVHLAAGRPGGVDEAWAVLCRTLPLPGLLARICDAPCRSACLRSERGGGLEMAALERFCADNATRTPRLVILPARGKAVAVYGGGLAGLAAAWDLARKGFAATLFSADPWPGLLAAHPGRLTEAALAEARSQLERLGVALAPARDLDRGAVQAALADFAAVVVDPELATAEALGLSSDPQTLAAALPGLFAAPRTALEQAAGSPAALAALGRRAAGSVERHVQGASLTAGREREGVFATRLFTDISRTGDLAPVPVPGTGYAPDQAAAEAARCLDCQCLQCVRHCAYLEHYGSYPKVYARRVFNNEAIVMGSRQANEFINSCMLCGLCAQVCPTDFAVADLCLEARQGMVARGRMPPSAHEFALRDMAFANGPHSALVRPALGRDRSPWAFFPGCQLPASDPGAAARAYALARQACPGGAGCSCAAAARRRAGPGRRPRPRPRRRSCAGTGRPWAGPAWRWPAPPACWLSGTNCPRPRCAPCGRCWPRPGSPPRRPSFRRGGAPWRCTTPAPRATTRRSGPRCGRRWTGWAWPGPSRSAPGSSPSAAGSAGCWRTPTRPWGPGWRNCAARRPPRIS